MNLEKISFKQQARLFFMLLKMDLKMVTKDFLNSLFDTSIWVGLSVFCNGYILPKLGITSSYGALVAIGSIVNCGAFQTFVAAFCLIGDFVGEKTINYELMLPISGRLIFLKTMLTWTIKVAALSIIIFPLSKLILMDLLDLSQINYTQAIISFVVTCLASGAISVFAASIPQDLFNVDRVWTRFIYPFWILGGSVFPFIAAVKAFPNASRILLLNPFIYATESLRAATLGSGSHYLPFWTSIGALITFCIVIFFAGLYRLKKRLDFV